MIVITIRCDNCGAKAESGSLPVITIGNGMARVGVPALPPMVLPPGWTTVHCSACTPTQRLEQVPEVAKSERTATRRSKRRAPQS